jgi:hypothetical protein
MPPPTTTTTTTTATPTSPFPRVNRILKKLNKIEEVMKIIQKEPNWEVFEYKGYACLIRRNMISGTLCGYVGLPPGHKFYEQPHEDLLIEVHGGLTFGEKIPDTADDELYWIGFDCCHYNDLMPFMDKHLNDSYSRILDKEEAYITYKDVGFVRGQIKQIVDQL